MENENVLQEEAAEVVEEAVEATETASADAKEAKKPYRQAMKRRKKVCIFCADKIEHVDYKDVGRLKKCVSERGKILPRRVSGACTLHQRQLTSAVKRARYMALMPYISD